MPNRILLSFDVEEFDLPLEHGESVTLDTQMEVSASGLKRVLELLSEHEVLATFFTTAHFATHHPQLVKYIAEIHEVASHGYFHSQFEESDLLESRMALEDVTGQSVSGFRRARMLPTDQRAITEAGYHYSSSTNPTWIPGRYNNLRAPRRPYLSDDLLNIPVSTVPVIRAPLFWLSFKIVPALILKSALSTTLRSDGHLALYFHPWEFSDLSQFQIQGFIKRRCGDTMLQCLSHYISYLDRQGDFRTYSQYDQWFRTEHSVK